MLKFLLFAGIGCVGLVVAVAFYAAWKITKMGRDLGRGGVTGGGRGVNTTRHDDYITTTGSTVHDWKNDDSPSSSLSYSAGESIGSDIGSSATDFGSSDSGSSDSGSSDSGSSSSD